MGSEFDWRYGLRQLFSGYVNQGTLDEAADQLVGLSAGDVEHHEECMLIFDKGESLAIDGDDFIIHCINYGGGYQVRDFEEALSLVRELKSLYLEKYGNAVGKN